MEQEQILSTLNEKLGKTSLSERTINDYVSENLPGEGEEFNFDKHVRILRSLNGNFSKSVADTVTRQVEDFKKNYSPKPKEEKKEHPEEDSYLKTLTDRIAALEGKITESERKNRTDSIRGSVSSLDRTLNVSNRNLWRDSVAMAEITEKDSEETVTAKAKKIYERKLREYFGDGAAPYGGGGEGGKNRPDSETVKARREAFKAKMKSQGRL